MAKDRNTFVKFQRELGKKRKADEKRQRRVRKKQDDGQSSEIRSPHEKLTPAEQTVLGVFRKFLMTPGTMLCFASNDLETYHRPLAELTGKGLLVEERFRGGYSLTDRGFAAMRDGSRLHRDTSA